MNTREQLPVTLCVIPIAHGYRDKFSNEPDERTKKTFYHAATFFRGHKLLCEDRGCKAKFIILKSIVRNTPAGPYWHEILYKLALSCELEEADIMVTGIETWNATTDGLAICEVAWLFSGAQLYILPYASGSVSIYLEATYDAVARHIQGWRTINLNFTFSLVHDPISLFSSLKYFVLYMVTSIAALNKYLYRAWFNLYNRLTIGRKEQFTRTVR